MKPWENEPDEDAFVASDLQCRINRTKHSGALCGYVQVPVDHPLYGLHYGDTSDALASALERRKEQPLHSTPEFGAMIAVLCGSVDTTPDCAFTVHGGLTFAGKLCDEDGWWFGFDCAHSGDLAPSDVDRVGVFAPSPCDRYRDMAYVRRECESLAAQIHAVPLNIPGDPEPPRTNKGGQ